MGQGAKIETGMQRRIMKFEYPAGMKPHWKRASPEFSQIVNAASLAMPYLEPYLIRSMGIAKKQITDPALLAEVEDYVAQEAAHYKQHRRFNDTLKAHGYDCIADLEARLKRDYEGFSAKKSLKFNLAYAEGFESMALAIGHMLIERREELFGGADPAVSSLVLWHFVEEIEHKNVAFDVYDHLYGGYFYRIFGLLTATLHIFAYTGIAYRALLREDGLWPGMKTKWAMWKELARIYGWLIPKMARVLKPGYRPSQIADPQWALDWVDLHNRGEEGLNALDTDHLTQAAPALAA
jgi:hypothetical protein